MGFDMPISADKQARTLQICNLPSWADEEYLCLCFYLFHAVPPYRPDLHVKIIGDNKKGSSSRYGFMIFETQRAAERVLRLYNGLVTMPGTKIRFCLNWAFPKSERTATRYKSYGSIRSSSCLRLRPVQFINNEKKTPESCDSILSTVSDIPLDVIEDIMLRLPVKSIRRFRAVCKAWASLMSGPDFIYRHLEIQRSNSNGIVALGRISKKQYNTYFFSDYSMESVCCIRTMHFKFPDGFTHTTPSYDISNSCNGLVCVYDKNFISVINPTIQETVQLPKSSNFPKNTFNEVSVGLGYDNCLDTYKIVRMMRNYTTVNIRYEVMDLGSANCNWRLLGCITGYRVVSLVPPVFVHGVIYWLISNSDFQEAIFSFDVRTETVRLISVPEARSSYNNLIVMEECLCILCVYSPNYWGTKVANLYVLEDSVHCEWVKKYTIKDIHVLSIYTIVNCDGKIFVILDGDELSLEQHYYDMKTGSRGKRTILSPASRSLIRLDSIRAYTESLVSPISYLQRSNSVCPVFHLFGQRWATVFPTNSSASRSQHHIYN